MRCVLSANFVEGSFFYVYGVANYRGRALYAEGV